MKDEASSVCLCEICRRNKAFVVPKELLAAVGSGNAVIFAGGGASTEDKVVFPYTLYEDVARELSTDLSVHPPEFPALMSQFCDRPNGRANLFRKIKERFDYIRAFPEIYGSATKFHRELGPIFQLDTIVTTNWDDYFERECGATPFVYPEDFTMWDSPGRKVFKIHGSINNLGSIVATLDDYALCYDRLREGVIGSALKTMLATKTIIYVGYSFQDRDFRQIHEILTSEMRGTRPHSYLVTLDEGAQHQFDTSITVITTEASFFLKTIKQHLVAEGHLLPDHVRDRLSALLIVARAAHSRMDDIDLRKYPIAILTHCYQDGLIHAFERVSVGWSTGQYSHSCDLRTKILAYDEIRKERLARRQYHDVAYIDGYVNGIVAALATEKELGLLPFFYIYGSSNAARTFSAYKRSLRESERIHKAAYSFCKRIVRDRLGNQRDMVFHHTPFLL